MKEISKLLTLLLALAMVLTLIPAVARAEEAMPEGGSGSAEIPVRVNPLYEGIYEPALEDMPQIPEPDEYSAQAVSYQTVEQAAATVRTNMKNRVETYNVYVRSTSSDYDALYFELLNGAVMHTGVGNEGDYLMWHLATYGGEVSWIVSDGYYNYTYTFAMTYYTTAEQEAETTTAVNNLISSLGVKNKSDYEKVCAVYDWMCANITYDYDHVNDSSYKLMFSAYAALVNKTAVCQGYAQLFYRLMLELGVDTRFIGGDGGGPHAWNIVQLGDYYYNVDSTWDAGQEEYSWFLTSFWDFPGHQRDLAYDTFEFHEAYPVAAESYEPGKTATKGMDITGGYCGTEDNGYANAMWILSRDGSLTIVGTGSTLDYNSSNQRPYFLYWESGITKVVVDEGITRIGNYAFYQLPNLTEVLTSESLEEIGQYAFYRCPKLAKVTFSEGLKTISQYAFRDCTSITALNLPDSLTTIGKGAFYGLTGITSLKLPSGLTEIGENAFYQCSALKEVVFPDNITVVGKGMFYYCTALEKVHLPANLVTIESGAFNNCTALKNVEFPDSLKTIGGTAFNFCTSLESIDLPEKLETIGNGAFLACRKVKSITFPANVTLGMNVLDQCTSLETVILPEGLTEIPQEMFARCSALKTVVIPESVTVIHGYAFNECTALESIDLPDHLTTIGRYAFTKCSSLSSIEIPKTVTVLEEGAFNACTSLKSANLPTNLQTIKDYTFYLCPLERVDIPAGVKSIGLNAFRGAMITELVIPEGVTTIDQNAFAACTELTKVDLPDSLKYLSGFGWCTRLTSIDIPEKVVQIGVNAFAGCTGLEIIRMPNTVTEVSGFAFEGCTGLKTVQMSMNVTDIGMDAFADCTALETITIPAPIEWIQYGVFRGCTQLKEIKFLGNAPGFKYDTFSGVTATAYYPANDATWTEDKLNNYGGTITWVPYGEASEPTAKIISYSTSLGGNIAMNFYVELSEDLVADPDAYIQFSFAGKTVNLPLSEGVLSGTSYRFACPITSKNMTDDITAQVYNANGPVGDAKTMAVDTYCNWIIANTSDQKTINLMKAMLNYGASAQMLFSYRTDDLANAALADADKVFAKVDASAFAHSRTGEEEGIKPVSYTLLLDSETTVRCYFELTGDKSIEEFTFTVDGEEVTPVYKDGYYYIEKANIAAHRLDDMHTFTCGNITITYGGMSYVNQVMTYYTSGTTFDMASALYAYSKAAEAYIG